MIRYSEQMEGGRRISLHDEEGFEGMRRAGRLAAATLDFIAPYVKPGVSTATLDRLCETYMRDHGGVPGTIGYHGYQHASCISVNHVVTHGIPSADKVLAEGDILNIDVTPVVDGWFGDTSRMFVAGEANLRARRLIDTTLESLLAAIAVVRPGATLGDIGHAIEVIARRERYGIVRDYCGHGVGQVFHDAPSVLHWGRPGTGVVLEPGMIFTIEPMLNAGRPEVKRLSDGWTVVTRDRSLSAQFEHSIGVTGTGAEIFTPWPQPGQGLQAAS
ncbi:type I methionyl aminopeptidase [Zavarzinia compransoris]|nr:type I methionyl aminopeptidase [Zavarzinia compransoris]TDP44803.1 methionine aminopeptidase type I [Zavarzinia compransoris]